MLYIIPIEPIQERYSKQWLGWTLKYLEDKEDYAIILPAETQTRNYSIENGSFLDVVKTNVFKNKQMKEILSLFKNDKVKDGDVFWFHDLWFPGIEQLAYIRDGMGIKFKICGYLHAGTYDKYDFLAQKGMGIWAEHFENSLFQIIDDIFVATKYHRTLLIQNRDVMQEKVRVVPFPISPDFAEGKLEPHYMRQPIVVFPHRLDPEKNPQKFNYLEHLFDVTSTKKFKFIKTKEETQNKSEYYNILKKAKYAVSFSDQETWGIAMQEAVMCGCIPIVPDKLSYSEMYAPIFKYVPDALIQKDTRYDEVCSVRDKILTFESFYATLLQQALEEQKALLIDRGVSAFKEIERWLFPKDKEPHTSLNYILGEEDES